MKIPEAIKFYHNCLYGKASNYTKLQSDNENFNIDDINNNNNNNNSNSNNNTSSLGGNLSIHQTTSNGSTICSYKIKY